jgi:hypothetical protein
MSGQIHPSVILEHKISNVKHQIEMKEKEIKELKKLLEMLEKMKGPK